MFPKIEDSEIDIVIAASRIDLKTFFEAWRPIISRFHIVIIKDPMLKEDIQIPSGFDHHMYTKSDLEQIVGPTSINFSGNSCRYFGYLVSRSKYIVSIDDDCFPASDNEGHMVDAVAQHITNLRTPATPFFLNTLYDPYRPGADFVRGYPFGLREGVPCMLSCGLWLNLPDYDSPTQVAKSKERNCRYVDAVITVPARVMMPTSGINVAFNREVLGPALFPGFQLTGEGKQRSESLEDIWSGMCAKVVCDHLKFGVKSGLPYVRRDDSITGSTTESLNREWEGAKLMEEAVPFFQSVSLSATAVLAEDCILELAGKVRQQLGRVDAIFAKAADAMEQWVKLWKAAASQA